MNFEFPDEQTFLEWWGDKKDVKDDTKHRTVSCPIARYIIEVGKFDEKDIIVTASDYRTEPCADDNNDRVYKPLPLWAMRFIYRADKNLKNKGPYKGIPEGYK